jgi:hypothetical protein
MTRNQFSLAVNADEKWVENAARLLKKRLSYTRAEARWMGLTHILNQEMGIPLARAAQLAEAALRYPASTRDAKVGVDPSGSAAISIDLARYHSAYYAALSAAMTLGGPRKRGRPRVMESAEEYGIDLDALRIGLKDSPAKRLERADENARNVAALRKGVRA